MSKIDYAVLTRAFQTVFNQFEDQVDHQIGEWDRDQLIGEIKEELVKELATRLPENEDFAEYANDLITNYLEHFLGGKIQTAISEARRSLLQELTENKIEDSTNLADEIEVQVEKAVQQHLDGIDLESEFEDSMKSIAESAVERALDHIDWEDHAEEIVDVVRGFFDVDEETAETLTDKVRELDSSFEEIESELQELKSSNSDLDDRLNEVERKDERIAELEEWRSDAQDALNELADVNDDIEGLREKIDRWGETIDGLEVSRGELWSEIGEHDERVSAQERVVATVAQSIDELREATGRRGTAIEEDVLALRQYVTEINEEVENVQEAGSRLEMEYRAKMAELSTKQAATTLVVENLTAICDHLESKVAVLLAENREFRELLTSRRRGIFRRIIGWFCGE